VRGSKTSRSCTHDGYPLRLGARGRLDFLSTVCKGEIDHEPFERHDPYGFVYETACTIILARMVACSTTDAWERVILLDYP
jgi:hypothetical protein